MNCLYLLINFCAFIVPFIFSFHPKLAFYKRWMFVFPAIVLSAVPFLVWDAYFTYKEVWGFNNRYLIGLHIYNLPLEEVLFFICIPYSCLFTYHCLNILLRKDHFAPYQGIITYLLIAFLLTVGLICLNKLYTSSTFLGLALLLLFIKFVSRPKWLPRFYFAYLILLIPFCIVNGMLTGTGLEQPVVWYNNTENMHFRLMTIPFEDVFYGMALILLNISLYEYLGSIGPAEKNRTRISV